MEETPNNFCTHTIPTILVSNIRSLAPKIDELECVSNMNNADVLCITESWLSAEISDNYIQLANFNLFRKDRPTRGGEVAIYNMLNHRSSVKMYMSTISQTLYLK